MVEVDNSTALAVFDRIPLPTQSERLQAARFLARNATRAHRDRLSKLRGTERNSWVRQALDQALKRSQTGILVADNVAMAGTAPTPIADERLHQELRAQSMEETCAMFLHELRPLVGFLDADAAQEIDGYSSSRTKHSVNQLRSFLEAMDRLRQASGAPSVQEFDLTDLVIRVAENEVRRTRASLGNPGQRSDENTGLGLDAEIVPEPPVVKLSPGRRDPVITTGDPALVDMAVANAIRNAIEAVLELEEANPKDIVLNWGITDTDSWIAVLDEGCGLPSGWEHLTEPGTSTKPKNEGHLGMGLPIAKKAIESMHGTFQLTPRAGTGVSCEIRWPRQGSAT